MNKLFYSLLALLLLGLAPASAQKVAGGDISLLTKYETNGAKYYTHDGTAITDVLGYFKDQGWNAMRVRLFVDPSNAPSDDKGEGVCQDLEYVTALGKRIKDKGFKFMLDFHYSDSWADPGQQWTPKAWASLDDDALGQKLYDYTKEVLTTLKAEGATPDYIQTGNEITNGMCWGVNGGDTKKDCWPGSTYWSRFTTLLQQAGKACREVCPKAKIIIHTEKVPKPDYIVKYYKAMDNAGVDYDIIGTSYYSYFHGDLNQLKAALDKIKANFTKDVMVVEAGYPAHYTVPKTTVDLTSTYPYSDEGQKKFTDDLITLLNGYSNVKGLFWWWPEANEYGLDWNTKRVTNAWYNATLFDNDTGKAYSAVSSLKDFISDTSAGIEGVRPSTINHQPATYNLQGQEVSDSYRGIVIVNGRKIIRK